MEKNHPINELMAETIQKIRETVDANTVVGEPIRAGDVVLIPVSRISFGFATGASEFGGKAPKAPGDNPFGGGGGAGVKVDPVCFLAVSGTSVKVLPVEMPPLTGMDKVVDMIPDAVNRISGIIEKRKGGE